MEALPLSASVRRLNHAVLYVRDAKASAQFYTDALGFEIVSEVGHGTAVFMRSAGTDNHHDLGLFSVGPGAPGPTPHAVGLYHLAWEVESIDALATVRQRLIELGAVAGQSDHGVSKSVYAKDPDGNEFEVMFAVPEEDWGQYATDAIVAPLDLDAELERYGST